MTALRGGENREKVDRLWNHGGGSYDCCLRVYVQGLQQGFCFTTAKRLGGIIDTAIQVGEPAQANPHLQKTLTFFTIKCYKGYV
jgi:hypothetical protein